MTTTFDSVWDALKDTPAEAANMRLRSTAMMLVREEVKGWGLSHRKAAERLGVTPPRLDELMNGEINRFNLDDLVSLAVGAGIELDLVPRHAVKAVRILRPAS